MDIDGVNSSENIAAELPGGDAFIFQDVGFDALSGLDDSEPWCLVSMGEQFPVEFSFVSHSAPALGEFEVIDMVDEPRRAEPSQLEIAQTLFAMPQTPVARVQVALQVAVRSDELMSLIDAGESETGGSRSRNLKRKKAAEGEPAPPLPALAPARAPKPLRRDAAASPPLDTDPDRDKKEKHTDVEKRRRIRERDTFELLRKTVKPLAKEERKPQRQEILEAAIAYIRELEHRIDELGGQTLKRTAEEMLQLDEAAGGDDEPCRKRRKS